MASKLLWISENGWRNLCLFRKLIKHLFNVDISLKTNDAVENKEGLGIETTFQPNECDLFEDYLSHFDIGWMHRVLLETDGPFQNIEKAQKFSCACFPSSPKYSVISIQLSSPQMFEMVYCCSTQIQQSTASLLKFDPDCLKVDIQGHEDCVALARKEINMILDDHLSQDALKLKTQQTNSSLFTQQQNQNILPSQKIDTASTAVQSRSLSPHELQLVGDSLIYEGCNNNNSTGCLSEIDHRVVNNAQNVDNQTSFSAGPPHGIGHISLEQKSSSCSSCAMDSDEDNKPTNNVLIDSRNSKHVEQAVKLGYNLIQIEIALEKLGSGCSSDDLLSELIKIGNEQSDETKTSSNDVQVLTESLNDFSLASSDSSEYSSLKRTSPVPSRPLDLDASDNLRSIVIDGSNVAMSHGQDKFSCKGIKIAVDWFKRRGHTDITVFVPQWRKEMSRPDAPIEDQNILIELERERIIVFTPSRRVQGRRIVSYDDRYVLKHAADVDGIVVSNDVYRDLVREREEFRKIIEERLLMYSFVKDKFMPPDDPFGRLGPSLEDFLRKVPSEPAPRPQDCPYGKKCTYGNKCRFYHPERGFASQKTISETLKEQASINRQEIASKKSDLALEKGKRQKQKLARTKSLVPGETLPQTFASDDSIETDGTRVKAKPKLGHSKSLIASSKNGDYLNASRLKLEEAESVDLDTSPRNFSLPEKVTKAPSDNLVSTSQKLQKHVKGNYSPSQRASPAPPSEVTMVGGTPDYGILPPSSYSLPFTRLTVPSPQPQQENFSSGHLSVAKKLSDEGSEKKFFEGSTGKAQEDQTQTPCGGEDSGNFSFSPQPQMSPTAFSSYPPLSMKKSDFLYSSQNLHRSLSSSHSQKGPTNKPRRSSEVIGIKNEHHKLRQQHSNPVHPHSDARASGFGPGGLLRQNSSSNPEIHAWGESFCDSWKALDSGCSVYYSAPLPEAVSACNSVQGQPQHVPSLPQHHEGMHYNYNEPPSRHPNAQQRPTQAQPAYPRDGSYSSYPYTPVDQLNFPYELPPAVPVQSPHGSVMNSYPYQQVHPRFQYGPEMTNTLSPVNNQALGLYQGHKFHSYEYTSAPPNPSQFTRPLGPQAHGQYKQEYPPAPYPGRQNSAFTFDQDAPIHPEDIRFWTYYNLSPVFGEQVVRNFMNRNPDVKDANQLIKLISAYKVDNGL